MLRINCKTAEKKITAVAELYNAMLCNKVNVNGHL